MLKSGKEITESRNYEADKREDTENKVNNGKCSVEIQ